jgi:hypothetical protein
MKQWRTLHVSWAITCTTAVASPIASPIASPPPMRPRPTAIDRPPAKHAGRFVDPDGDDAADGSVARPWKTIGHAVKQLRPGDTLYLAGGTYHEAVTVSVVGTAAAPITIRSAPNELAIIDGGFPEFAGSPKTAWEPVRGGAAGEYRSMQSYPSFARSPLIVGHFADPMTPLHSYRLIEDLRSTNEYWNLPNNAAPGDGIYLGPGVWVDRQTQRIHARFAPTTLAGQTNYSGEANPQKLALVIGGDRSPLRVENSQHVRFQDLVIRGSAADTVFIDGSDGIELDGVTIYAGNPALFVRSSSHLRLIRSVVRGLAAPWSSRASMKYRGISGYLVVGDPALPQSHDWELAYNEFTDSHDGFIFGSIKTLRFHHNLVDNLNDDGIFLNQGKRQSLPKDVQIYENVFSRILTTLAFAQDAAPGNPIGPGVYIYRNVFDLRDGTYNLPPKNAADQVVMAYSRVCGDHGSPTWEPLFVYHNTIITDGNAYRGYYGAQLVMGARGSKQRLFNNIFLQLSGNPGLTFGAPDDDLQVDGNLLWSVAEGPEQKGNFFAAFRGSAVFQSSKRSYPPGRGHADIYADPKLTAISGALDARLDPGSAAIDAGIAIPASWPDSLRKLDRGKPDIGALPAGAPMLRVGPAAAPRPTT